MGIILSLFKLIIEYMTRDDKTKICILGPAGAGKTTFLFYHNYKEKVFTIPTNGYNSEIYKFKKKDFILWDVGASHVRNWPGFIEAADFIFFVIDSSDVQSIHSGRELLYQIYFGKRFRTFVEQFKEKEIERKKLYFYEEEEEDIISYNGDDYLNLIEEESDYEMTLRNTKIDSDGTETDKTSNFELDVFFYLFSRMR
jgi:GTPase SAR1 family protein